MPARQYDVLMDKTYNGITASFNEVALLDTAPYRTVLVAIFQSQAWTGTTPKLQLDLVTLTLDGTLRVDYFNNGPQGGPFVYGIGPGGSVSSVVPPNMTFAYVVSGTTPNVSFRIVVYGFIE